MGIFIWIDMAVIIKSVSADSRFFKAGDEIISIESQPVEDQLDVIFLTADERRAEFRVRRKNGRILKRKIAPAEFTRASLELEQMRFKHCGSDCIFCFVDQMPPNLRDSLYQKDDDYRLSFLFGNYATLNNIRRPELDRIIRYNLSPLYVSVHSTQRRIREKMFGQVMHRDILKVIQRLVEGGIVIHSQVVLVPGLNDGAALERTVDNIFAFYPGCKSLAVVPVGLTRHRKGLEHIRRVGTGQARQLLDWAKTKGDDCQEKTGGDRFLQMADEFYLQAGRVFPASGDYGDYDQLSNGVGMSRMFIERIKNDIERLGRKDRIKTGFTVVTGILGGKLLRRYVLPLVEEKLPQFRIGLLPVKNRLFGSMVGVSGLLSGKDIVREAKRAGTIQGPLLLPPNCVNHEGKLIDDVLPREIERELGMPVLIPEESFLENRIIRLSEGRAR
ncbi:MAG: DUF512 domain-containing protein [Candidatus Krumholzibacteriota bacterium]|nr:DUF512 domain-containing protein [Candidatus Krumholzibacteriota bacterium]